MSLYDELQGAARPYKAVTADASAQWLYVPYSNGDVELLRPGNILAIGWAAAAPDAIALSFASGMVLVGGENMQALLRLMQAGVSELHLFDPAMEPPAPGEPVIVHIEWQQRE